MCSKLQLALTDAGGLVYAQSIQRQLSQVKLEMDQGKLLHKEELERVQASFGALESQNDELVQKVSLLEKELSERDSSRLDIESQLEQAHQELSTITGRLKQFDQARLEWSGEKQEMLEKLLEKDEQLHLTSDELFVETRSRQNWHYSEIRRDKKMFRLLFSNYNLQNVHWNIKFRNWNKS